MSETGTVTLAEFITARLDERVREIAELRELADSVGRVYGSPAPPEDDMRLGDIVYFALHAEADRVLREVEAMRRIVARHRPAEEEDPYDGAILGLCDGCGADQWEEYRYRLGDRPVYLDLCPDQRALASIWRDHPDFQEEWA